MPHEVTPDRADALNEAKRIAAETGDLSAGLDHLERAIEAHRNAGDLEPEPETDTDADALLVEAAAALHEKEERAETIIALRALLEKDPIRFGVPAADVDGLTDADVELLTRGGQTNDSSNDLNANADADRAAAKASLINRWPQMTLEERRAEATVLGLNYDELAGRKQSDLERF